MDPFFTPFELLELQAGLYGVRKKDRKTHEILEKVSLINQKDAYARTLSGGMRRRLLVAKALVHNPDVIILDEPTIGLDPRQIMEVRDLIKGLAGNHTVILSTHILPEVSMTCDRVVIINKGRIVASDTPSNLISQMGSGQRIELEVLGSAESLPSLLSEISQVRDVSLGQPQGDPVSYTHLTLPTILLV